MKKNAAVERPPLNVETTNNNIFLSFIIFSIQYFRITLLNRIYLGTMILRLVFFTQKAKCAEAMRVCQFGKNFCSVAMSAAYKNTYNSYDTRRKLDVGDSL